MTADTHKPESVLVTWVVIALVILLILFKGAFAYFLVGDRGQPGWDYRPLADVPAESPYGVYQPLPYPQHVRGAGGN